MNYLSPTKTVSEIDNGNGRALFDLAYEARDEGPFPDWLVRDLRSDHAGETGAVNIYRGAYLVARDAGVRDQIKQHLKHERDHLRAMELILPQGDRSLFLPIWRLAGWVLGIAGALPGKRAHALTVEAVETFVDRHYGEQIDRLERENIFPATLAVLRICREDEVMHRDEAAEVLPQKRGAMAGIWSWIVGNGSAAAVILARFR